MTEIRNELEKQNGAKPADEPRCMDYGFAVPVDGEPQKSEGTSRTLPVH